MAASSAGACQSLPPAAPPADHPFPQWRRKPLWFWFLYYTLAQCMINTVTFPFDFVCQEAVRIYPPLAHKAHILRYSTVPILPITPVERLAARLRFGLPWCPIPCATSCCSRAGGTASR
jgi:hypothetical protein